MQNLSIKTRSYRSRGCQHLSDKYLYWPKTEACLIAEDLDSGLLRLDWPRTRPRYRL